MRIVTTIGLDGGDPVIDRRAIWMTRPFDLEFQYVETCPPRFLRPQEDQPLPSRRTDDCN